MRSHLPRNARFDAAQCRLRSLLPAPARPPARSIPCSSAVAEQWAETRANASCRISVPVYGQACSAASPSTPLRRRGGTRPLAPPASAATEEVLLQSPALLAEALGPAPPAPLLSVAGGGIFFFHYLGAPGFTIARLVRSDSFTKLTFRL